MRHALMVAARARRDDGAAGARLSEASLLALVFMGFISLGLPDGLLGVAWPAIRQSFGTPLEALGALLLTVATGYLVSSLGSGWVVKRLGVGLLLALSSLTTALGLLGYALAPSWAVMVALGLAAGAGAGAIDAGLNAYVALHHSSRLLHWLHASYGLGAASGPLIMMMVLSTGSSWRWGYAIVGVAQVVLGTCFLLTFKWWPGPGSSGAVVRSPVQGMRPRSAWRLPAAWLSIALFFVYTGLEAAGGQWPYSLFTESRHAAPGAASLWVSVYWGGLAVGRLLFGFVANRVDQVRMLRGSMLGVLGGGALIWANLSDTLSFLGLGLMGLAAATIFPALIGITPRRLGAEHAASIIGFQVGAASLGAALVPGLAGVLAERFSLEIIPPFIVGAAIITLLLHEAIVARTR